MTSSPPRESLLHAAIYRARPDINAVMHTHSVFCSVAAVAGLEIPPIIDEMVIAIAGLSRSPSTPFQRLRKLADSVCAAAWGERNAALIRHHGAVGVGGDLREALDVCTLGERAAQVFVYASLLGKVDPLPPDVVEAELAIFRMRRQGGGGQHAIGHER